MLLTVILLYHLCVLGIGSEAGSTSLPNQLGRFLELYPNTALIGQWNIDNNFDNQRALHYHFENHKGLLKMKLGYDEVSRFFNITIQLFDGNYADDRLVQIQTDYLSLENPVVTASNTYVLESISTTISEYTHYSTEAWPVQIYSRTVTIGFHFLPGQSLQMTKRFDITVSIEDSEGDLVFSGTAEKKEHSTTKVVSYCLLFVTLAVIKIVSTWKLIWMSTEYYHIFKKISVITILLVFVWDAALIRDYLIILHDDLPLITHGFLGTLAHLLILSETILCGIIWSQSIVQSQNFDDPNTSDAVYALKICSTVLVVLVVCAALSYSFDLFFSDTFKIILSFYLIPQIIKNALEFIPCNLSFTFVGYNVFIILIVYVKGIVPTLSLFRPSPSFCLAFLAIVALQFLVLMIQTNYDARFFIPESCMGTLAVSYKFQNLEDEESQKEDAEKVCAICLGPLDSDASDVPPKREIEVAMKRLRVGNKKLMKTQCNHTFHIRCLLEWLETKPACPICRQELEKIL